MLEERSDEQEIMDDLTVSGPVINQTLKELNTINQLLGGKAISLSRFKTLVESKKVFSLADLGCGGGDILMSMAKWSRKKRKEARFIGIDANPYIVEYAIQNTAHYPEITYMAMDIFSDDFKLQSFDIVHCSLFLHHFSKKEIIALLTHFNKTANIGVIINDLHRHPLAYWSISLLTRLFSNSTMVQNDASVSVAKGFRKGELKEMLSEAGIIKYRLKWRWAFRWELTF